LNIKFCMKGMKKTIFNAIDQYTSISLGKHDDYIYIRIDTLVTSKRPEEMHGFNVDILGYIPQQPILNTGFHLLAKTTPTTSVGKVCSR
jgi:hypothetical protein